MLDVCFAPVCHRGTTPSDRTDRAGAGHSVLVGGAQTISGRGIPAGIFTGSFDISRLLLAAHSLVSGSDDDSGGHPAAGRLPLLERIRKEGMEVHADRSVYC